MKECIFCKIINKKVPAEIVYEDEKVRVFKDIHPLAPCHLLIVPKKHIPSVEELTLSEKDLAYHILAVACQVAKEKKLSTEGVPGYKLVFNVGRGGGQIIDHLHLHLLGGWKSKKERDIPGMP